MNETARAENGLGYAVNAPYYDLIFPAPVRATLEGALRTLLPDARTVAEIGPGTGLFTETLARLLGPEAEIFAIEPARIMRAALMTRLARLPEANVTVVPDDALDAELDVELDAVVLFNLIMHFGPDDRTRLWRKWAGALRPGGTLIMETQFPQTATPVPETVVPGGGLGRHRYDTVSRADVIDKDRIRWVMTYRTWAGDKPVRAETADFDCYVISDEILAQELTAAGLVPHPASPEGIQAWQRPHH
ncbi:class I SAM-dependent methyltransferase [Actinomadura fulvescens]|uniref:Methyltransferase domain-containing protein n=1 Tax=Actinomadura fulvescens TaxID=46160 RepID=A0ABP6C7V7_9ACTN